MSYNTVGNVKLKNITDQYIAIGYGLERKQLIKITNIINIYFAYDHFDVIMQIKIFNTTLMFNNNLNYIRELHHRI